MGARILLARCADESKQLAYSLVANWRRPAQFTICSRNIDSAAAGASPSLWVWTVVRGPVQYPRDRAGDGLSGFVAAIVGRVPDGLAGKILIGRCCMLRISGMAALALIVIATNGTSGVRAADAWGCSFDKCLQVCGKLAGKNCSKYCNDRLADKRRDKICT